MSKIGLAAALAGGLVLALSGANGGTLIPVVPFPGSTDTTALGMNNNGTLVGWYTDSAGNEHGFFGTIDGQYTSFDFPDGQTIAIGISDNGTIDGLSATTDECPLVGCQYIRRPGGNIAAIVKGHSKLDGQAEQIIDSAKFVGEVWSLDQQGHLTIAGYFGKDAKYKRAIELPFNTTRTRPRGINTHGMIDGYYLRDTGGYAGFFIKDGFATSTTFPDSNAYYTELEGSNTKGQIAGGWFNQDQTVGQAFIYDPDTDSYNVIPVPGEDASLARQINDKGVVVILGDTTFQTYIYCTRKRTCPSSPHAIEVADKWVRAKHDGHHWTVCREGCMKALTAVPARTNPAALREAIKHDPMLAMERRAIGLR